MTNPSPGASLTPTRSGIEPAILYWGTPVVLLSTLNPDDTPNLAPMSSAWWLGWGCMLGLTASAHSVDNLRRTGESVLNLPSVEQAAAVDRIAKTTGANPVPPDKAWLGFEYEPDKFGRAGLTPLCSEYVAAPRAAECPVQMEAVVEKLHPFGATNPMVPTDMLGIEVRIVRVHAHENIVATDDPHRIDPDAWRPLIMSFRKFYGLGPQVVPSRLSDFPEDLFRPAPRGATDTPPEHAD